MSESNTTRNNDQTFACYSIDPKHLRVVDGKKVLPITEFKDSELMTRYSADDGESPTCFRSSGTTSSERSWSRFSPKGLELYRQRSIKHLSLIHI